MPNGAYYRAAKENVLTEEEVRVIVDFEEENTRLGNFDRIFPLKSNAAHYA
jgi:hypothetical protein